MSFYIIPLVSLLVALTHYMFPNLFPSIGNLLRRLVNKIGKHHKVIIFMQLLINIGLLLKVMGIY